MSHFSFYTLCAFDSIWSGIFKSSQQGPNLASTEVNRNGTASARLVSLFSPLQLAFPDACVGLSHSNSEKASIKKRKKNVIMKPQNWQKSLGAAVELGTTLNSCLKID